MAIWNARRFDPVRELIDLSERLNRLRESGRMSVEGSAGSFPPINVVETEDRFVARIEVPGVDPADVDLTVTGDTLSIRGERPAPDVDEKSFHRRERRAGYFQRSLALPDRVDVEGIEARLDEGLLTVDLPKVTEERPRQVRIAVGEETS